MASATDANSDPVEGTLYRVLKRLRGSLLLSAVAVGVAMVLLGAVFDSGLTITQNDGVIAGMLGVFGISAVVAGAAGYALVRLLHRL